MSKSAVFADVILSREHSERVETSQKSSLLCHSEQEYKVFAVEESHKSNYNHDLNIAFKMIPKIKLTVARNIERRTSIPSVFF